MRSAPLSPVPGVLHAADRSPTFERCAASKCARNGPVASLGYVSSNSLCVSCRLRAFRGYSAPTGAPLRVRSCARLGISYHQEGATLLPLQASLPNFPSFFGARARLCVAPLQSRRTARYSAPYFDLFRRPNRTGAVPDPAADPAADAARDAAVGTPERRMRLGYLDQMFKDVSYAGAAMWVRPRSCDSARSAKAMSRRSGMSHLLTAPTVLLFCVFRTDTRPGADEASASVRRAVTVFLTGLLPVVARLKLRWALRQPCGNERPDTNRRRQSADAPRTRYAYGR